MKPNIVKNVDMLSLMLLEEVLADTVGVLQAHEQEARIEKALAAVHEQQAQLAVVLDRVRAQEADIISKVSMLKIDASPGPEDGDTCGEQGGLVPWPPAASGTPNHELAPVISDSVLHRLQAHREEYLRSLQEWESILFDESLNQWVVEDLIAADIVDGVLESVARELEATLDAVVDALVVAETAGE